MTKYAIVNKESLSILKKYSVTLAEEEPKHDTEIYWLPHLCEPTCFHAEIAENLDDTCIKAELVEDVIVIVEDSTKASAKIAEDKVSRIKAREDACDADILSQQITTYGFKSEGACTRCHLTWQDMITNPSAWTSEQLPTSQAVVDYATPLLAASKTFAVYCSTRWGTYLAEKAAIEAE